MGRAGGSASCEVKTNAGNGVPVADGQKRGPNIFTPIRTNLSKDEAKSSSICDDIRKIVQISLLEGARPWQVYHRWSVP